MLIPRFTLRTILAITTACALLFLVVGVAARGQTWAWGVAYGVLSLGVALVVYAAWFLVIWSFSKLSPPREARRRSTLPPVVLLAAALGSMMPGGLRAQVSQLQSVQSEGHGFTVAVPTATTYSQQRGLRLHIDSRWPNNFGYRPIRVEVLSQKPAKSEHRFRLLLHVVTWDMAQSHMTVEQSFDMPVGATEASTTIACPQFHAGQQYWWELWVDGVKDKELSVTEAVLYQLQSVGNAGSQGGPLKFLVVGDAPGQKVIGGGPDVFEAITVRISELPARWIDFSAVDVIALSPNDLEQLQTTRPMVLQAIEEWVRAGGQLWVHPVGEQWEQLGEVEQLLHLTSASHSDGKKIEDPSPEALAERDWLPIKLTLVNPPATRAEFRNLVTGEVRTTEDANEISKLSMDQDFLLINQSPMPVAADQSVVAHSNQPTDSGKWYVQHPLGLGHVRAFSGEWDPVGFGISWRMLFGGGPSGGGQSGIGQQSAGPLPTPVTAAMDTTRGWESRHGMAPNFANEEFANLLVPGVGLAPVTEFRILITVFVIVMGPLNYWLLKRSHRLHLMLVTVPGVALALTLGLFAYAFLSDGFSTRARVHSFTALDQRSGNAATWARLSYYSSFAPSRGLQLPMDVALYPILPGWNTAGGGAVFGSTRTLKWDDEGQRLAEGWLRSRVPTQYLSVRSRKTPHKLVIEAGNDSLHVENKLGANVQYLAVVDGDGNIFCGESIGEGAEATLKPAKQDDVLRRIRTFVTERRPETPTALAMEPTILAQMHQRQQRHMYRRQYGTEYSGALLQSNLANEAVATIAGTNRPVDKLPKRTYYAITETGPEVEFGMPGVVEEASFHVIEGKW